MMCWLEVLDERTRHLDALLVGLAGGLVLVLVELVAGSGGGTGEAVGDGAVANVALGLLCGGG